MKTLAVGDNSLTISDNSLTIVDAAELSVCVHLRHWTSPTHQTGWPTLLQTKAWMGASSSSFFHLPAMDLASLKWGGTQRVVNLRQKY